MNISAIFSEPWQLWIIAILGLGLLFAGYKIKQIAFFIIWFILGYSLTGYLMPFIMSAIPDLANTSFWQWLLPCCGGILLAFMGCAIERLCVGGLTFGLVMIISVAYFGTAPQVLAIGAVVGAIAGGIAAAMIKPAIIISSSLSGAHLLTTAILLLAGLDQAALYWPILIGLTAVGSGVQWLTSQTSCTIYNC